MTIARPDIVVKDDEIGSHQAFLRCMSLVTTRIRNGGSWERDDDEWIRGEWCIRLDGNVVSVFTPDDALPSRRRGLVQVRGLAEEFAQDDPQAALLVVHAAMRMIDGRGDEPEDVRRMQDWAVAMLSTASKGLTWTDMAFASPFAPGRITILPGSSVKDRGEAERLLSQAPIMMHWNAYIETDAPHLHIRPMSLRTGVDHDAYALDDAIETLRSIARVEEEIRGRARPGRA